MKTRKVQCVENLMVNMLSRFTSDGQECRVDFHSLLFCVPAKVALCLSCKSILRALHFMDSQLDRGWLRILREKVCAKIIIQEFSFYTLLLFLSFFLLYYFTFVLNLFYMVLGGEGGPCEHHYYGSTNRGPLVVTRFWIGAHITSHHC